MKLLVLFPLLLVALIVGADDASSGPVNVEDPLEDAVNVEPTTVNAFREKVEGMKLLKKDLEDDVTTTDRFSVVDYQAPEATKPVDAEVQPEKPYPVPFNATLTLNLTSTNPHIDAKTEDVIVERADVQKSTEDPLDQIMITLPGEIALGNSMFEELRQRAVNDKVYPEGAEVLFGKPDGVNVGGPFPPPPVNEEEIIERNREAKPALRGDRHGDKISDNNGDKTDADEGKDGPGLDVDGDLLSLRLSRNSDEEATEATSEKRTGRGWGKILGGLVKVFGKIAAAKKGEASAREESDAVSDEAVDVKDDGKELDDVSEKTTSRGGAVVKILGGLAKLLTRAAAKKKSEANENAVGVDVDGARKDVEDGKTDVSSGWEGVRKAIEKHFQETQDSGNENTEFGSVDGDELDSDAYDNTEREEDEDVYIVVEGADGRPELIRRPDDGLEDEEAEEEEVNEEDENEEDEDEDGMEFQSMRGLIKGAIKVGTKLIKGGVKVIKKGGRLIKNVGRKAIRAGRKYKSHFKRFGKEFVQGGVNRVLNTDGEGGDYARRETEEEGYEEQDETGEGEAETARGPVRGNRGGPRVRAAPVFERRPGNGPAVERAARGRPTDRGSDEDDDEE